MIGNGNVAVDVARMLVLDPEELAVTDTADHAIDAARRRRGPGRDLLGRRGPAQAAFTNPELRELGELTRADVVVDPAELELDAVQRRVARGRGRRRPPSATSRSCATTRSASRTATSHRIELRFLRSPVEILGEGEDGPVTGIRVVNNRIEDGRAVPTGEEEVISCGLVLRSIGYRGRRWRASRSTSARPDPQPGRARLGDDGEHEAASTSSAGSSAARPASSAPTRRTRPTPSPRSSRTARPARSTRRQSRPARLRGGSPSSCPELVTWEGWRAIDAHETGLGEPQGRPRVKLVRTGEMLDIASGASLSAQPRHPQRDVAEEPVLAAVEVHARDLLDPAEPVVEARAVQPQLGRRALDVAGVVEVGLERLHELLVTAVEQPRTPAGMSSSAVGGSAVSSRWRAGRPSARRRSAATRSAASARR